MAQDNGEGGRRLHIGVVCGLLHPSFGGPFSVVRAHVKALRAHADVSVFGVAPGDDLAAAYAVFPGARVFPLAKPARWFRGEGLARAMRHAAPGIDVWHGHMLWDHPVWSAAKLAKQHDKPLVITPHGSVSESWRSDAPHKKAYRRLLLDRAIGPRTALHALNPTEAEACRRWSPERRVEVVPNGLPRARFMEQETTQAALERWPQLRGRRVALYLGRLWGEKGLDLLPDAWAASGTADDWTLVLAGPDYRGYETQLRARLETLGLRDRVLLTGPVFGAAKWSLLNLADAFLLPSKSEGFSMAALEAMAARTPALLTPEANFPELAAAGGAWLVPRTQEDWTQALKTLRGRSAQTLAEAGAKAHALGLRAYTAESVADRLMALYRSL